MNRRISSFFDFIIFSNLFIACCAVAMCIFPVYFFKLGALPVYFIAFVFFSTLSSYSIHWYLTNAELEVTATRTRWLKRHKKIHAAFFIISAVGSLGFFLLLQPFWLFILPAVLLTIMYSAPKFPFPVFKSLERHILGKTFLLAAMWTYVTAVFPLLVQAAAWNGHYTVFVLQRFALLFPVCILFDIRDKQYDQLTGVRSIVTMLPPEKLKIIFSLFLVLNITSSFFLYTYSQHFTNLIFLILPGIITFFLYPVAIKSKNDYLFYFILDGLMALTPVLYFAEKLFGRYV